MAIVTRNPAEKAGFCFALTISISNCRVYSGKESTFMIVTPEIPFIPAAPWLRSLRFIPLGNIEIDEDVKAVLSQNDVLESILKHWAGKWGYVTSKMAARNEEALLKGKPLVSVHRSSNGIVFKVITFADRSSTFIAIGE